MSVLLRLSAGLAIWAMVFAALYAAHGLGCASGWADRPMAGTNLQDVVLLTLWVAGIALALVAALVLHRRERATAGESMLERAAVRLAWIAVAATAVTGLPIALVPTCL